jgi:hypothetical protein
VLKEPAVSLTSNPTMISIRRRLRAAVNGRIITPGDVAYDQARQVFYGGFDRHPALIVRPADAGDVAQVVDLARERGLDLAVRSGGHSLAGHGTTDGGIVLGRRSGPGMTPAKARDRCRSTRWSKRLR